MKLLLFAVLAMALSPGDACAASTIWTKRIEQCARAEPEDALVACTQILNAGIPSLQPDRAKILVARARAYDELGRPADAMVDFDQAIANWPEPAAFTGACKTRAEQATQFELALVDCNHALALRPNDFKALDSRALLAYRMSNYAQAISDSTAALAENSHLATSLFIRGLAREASGDAAGNADITAAKAIDAKIGDTFAGYGVTP